MNTLFDFKNESVAFTGHRHIAHDKLPLVKAYLKEAILEAYNRGARKFYCGMAMGFDMLAAEVTIGLRFQYKDISIIAVVPFKEQDGMFTPNDKIRYQKCLKQMNDVIILSNDYYKGCLLKRNDYLLSHANSIIAYFDGNPKGGTFYTIRKAYDKCKPVKNIYRLIE